MKLNFKVAFQGKKTNLSFPKGRPFQRGLPKKVTNLHRFNIQCIFSHIDFLINITP